MTPVKRRKKRDEIKITIAPFRKISDYVSCLEIQREVWSYEDIDIVPVAMLLAADHYGGISLGAYNSLGEMVGFTCSILGSEKSGLVHHSHMLGVRNAYRNFDVGFKLKMAQRKEVLKRKIPIITWTFDPMQPLNAYFNLGKLSCWGKTYHENFYGETTSDLDRGLPTDRIVAHWYLDNKEVQQRLESGPPRRDLRKELKKYPIINKLEEIGPGMTTSSTVKPNFTAKQVLFEIPYNLPDLKSKNLGVALEWQGKMRQVFRAYFKKGYSVTDFWLAEDEGHLRTFYFFEKKKLK
jgi:predicted GNAT superfamily acetyltransferase